MELYDRENEYNFVNDNIFILTCAENTPVTTTEWLLLYLNPTITSDKCIIKDVFISGVGKALGCSSDIFIRLSPTLNTPEGTHYTSLTPQPINENKDSYSTNYAGTFYGINSSQTPTISGGTLINRISVGGNQAVQLSLNYTMKSGSPFSISVAKQSGTQEPLFSAVVWFKMI